MCRGELYNFEVLTFPSFFLIIISENQAIIELWVRGRNEIRVIFQSRIAGLASCHLIRRTRRIDSQNRCPDSAAKIHFFLIHAQDFVNFF